MLNIISLGMIEKVDKKKKIVPVHYHYKCLRQVQSRIKYTFNMWTFKLCS